VIALETALGYGGTVPTVNPTASTIAKRDASGNISFNTVNAATGVGVPRSSGTALFAIDGSAFGSTLTIANDATATPFGGTQNFSGMFLINDTTVDGALGMFINGSATILVSQTSTIYTITINTASKINVYAASGAITIQNKTGVSRVLNVVAIRSRAA